MRAELDLLPQNAGKALILMSRLEFSRFNAQFTAASSPARLGAPMSTQPGLSAAAAEMIFARGTAVSPVARPARSLWGRTTSSPFPVSIVVREGELGGKTSVGASGGVAREFVAKLAEQSLQHRAVNHPYLEALGSGNLPDMHWALADFGRHYHGYSKEFPRYLTAVISRLEDPSHRAGLMENLTEESGVYEAEELAKLDEIGIESDWIVDKPHPVLFTRFCKAMGVDDEDLLDVSDQVVCWREMFLSLLTAGTPAEAVGALGLGTENIVSTIYQPFCSAVDGLSELSPRDTVFFPLHTAVDDHHQETLQGIAADLAVDEDSRSKLRLGMLKALSLRSSFWDWMYSRALSPQTADQIL